MTVATSTPGEVLRDYVGALVDGLYDAGVRNVCLCPGSRSTPLALVFRRSPKFKLWIHLDERSCSYFALGMAKRLREPVALVCTSGSAAVNFAPAVVEAFYSHVPLVVLTADRPAELRGVGANQTIDQVNLYGAHVKFAENALLPDNSGAALRYIRVLANRAAATTLLAPAGPVHLNLPFREPLTPAPQSGEPAAEFVPAAPRVGLGRRQPAQEQVESLRSLFAGGRGVIVCGPQDDPAFPGPVAALARAAGSPLLADPLSGVRTGPQVDEHIVANYDNFIRDPALAEELRPQFVLRFGAPPTSKPLGQYLERHASACQIVVSNGETWLDPDGTASEFVFADPVLLCDAISAACPLPGDSASPWLAAWQSAAERTATAMDQVLDGETDMSEPQVIQRLARVLPDDALLYAGNSMPVRDFDSCWPASPRSRTLLGNRGTSGIDGVVSSALGAAAAREERVTLVIGDLSFYHDMNGLFAIRRHGIKATIVLVNNDGGGIFSFLPQAGQADAEQFEDVFGTPHGLDFRPVASLYGLTYRCAASVTEFDSAVSESYSGDEPYLIEVKTDRRENVALHQRLWSAVRDACEGIRV